MRSFDRDPLLALSELVREQRQEYVEWEEVTLGRVEADVVAQRWRARGVSEEEIGRARALFEPLSDSASEAIIERVLAATARSSGECLPVVAEVPPQRKLFSEAPMSWIILLVLLIVVLAVIPTWPYSQGWGYNPAGLLGAVLLVLLVLKLLHKI